jgi:hypothetical protein
MTTLDAETEKAVDSVIERLLSVRGNKPGKATQVQLKEDEIHMLVNKSREIFMAQPVLLELEAPLKIVGDVHGQYPDLLRLFEYGGFREYSFGSCFSPVTARDFFCAPSLQLTRAQCVYRSA